MRADSSEDPPPVVVPRPSFPRRRAGGPRVPPRSPPWWSSPGRPRPTATTRPSGHGPTGGVNALRCEDVSVEHRLETHKASNLFKSLLFCVPAPRTCEKGEADHHTDLPDTADGWFALQYDVYEDFSIENRLKSVIIALWLQHPFSAVSQSVVADVTRVCLLGYKGARLPQAYYDITFFGVRSALFIGTYVGTSPPISPISLDIADVLAKISIIGRMNHDQ